MPATTDVSKVRGAVLEAMRKVLGEDRGSPREVFAEAMKALKGARIALPDQEKWDLEAAILRYWNDLLRNGTIGLGDLGTGDFGTDAFFLTDEGRKTLEHLNCDPSNPDGYMQHLNQCAAIDPIPASYIKEALHTYNAACFKATAVMVGTAAEGMILRLRDSIAARIQGAKKKKGLEDWRIKIVCDELGSLLEAHQAAMPPELSGAFNTHWAGFTSHIRAIRNKSGHPNSIDPVTAASVHAALLLFPEFAKLVADLQKWATSHTF